MLRITPKLRIANLLGMLEAVHELASGAHEFIPLTVSVSNLFQKYLVACLGQAAPCRHRRPRSISGQRKGDVEIYDMDAVIVDEAASAY